MPLGAFKLNSLGKFTAPAGRTAKTVTVGGNAKISTAQSKFGGASALFDGTSDYLSVSSGGFNVGTNDITIEFWARHTAINDQQVYCDFRTGANNHFIFYMRSDNKLELYDGGSTYTSTVTMAANTWYHLAISRSGTSLKVYRDGTEVMSATNSRNLSDNSSIVIGSSYEFFSTNSVNGYMDEIRVSNSARYTANFTPSTTAFTSDANTLFLLHCDGTDATTTFTDDIGTNAIPRTPRTITVGGNAKVSTAQSKFGGASALFDGTSDYLSVPGFSDLAFGTGSFTLEAWVRQSARSDAMNIFDTRNSGNTSGGFTLYMRADNYMELYWNTALVSSANPLPTVNTWYHVAMSKSGNDLKVFVDGTAVMSYTLNSGYSQTATGPFIIGQDFQLTATPGNSWNGYIDEVRFSPTARYTANFTAPTTPFTNDRDTLLLLHCNGANNSTTFTDDVDPVTTYAVPAAAFTSDANTVVLYHFDNALTDSGPSNLPMTVSGGYTTAQVKFGTYSGNLTDSTSDYFSRATNGNYGPYNGTAYTDWCMEGWFYYTTWSGASQGVAPNALRFGDAGGNNSPIWFGFRGDGAGHDGKLAFWEYTRAEFQGSTVFALNTWHHIAVTYNATTGVYKIWANGNLEATSPSNISPLTAQTHITFGGANAANSSCYVDEVRISRTLRYGT